MKKYFKLRRLFPKWGWLPFFVSMLFVSLLSAQNVERLDDKFASDPDGTQILHDLVTNINPIVYLSDGNLNAYGNGSPVVLEYESGGFARLYTENELFSEVKLINIKVNNSNELQNSLNLSRLAGFESLEYVVVQFTFDVCENSSDDCVAPHVQQMISGTPQNPVSVFYKLSIPD